MDSYVAMTVICVAVVLFHFLGYPLLLLLRCALVRRPVCRSNRLPGVSLIISAYNEAEVIEAKIRNSLELDYPADKLEIVVVADGSDDETPEIVKRYSRHGVRLVYEPARRGKSAAVNRGYNNSSKKILVFSDANAFYQQDALKKLVRNFGDYKVGGVSGRKTVKSTQAAVAKSEGLYWRYESAIKRMESCAGSTVGVVGEMIAMRRNLFSCIPAHAINDDSFLMLALLRRGQRVVYEPEAVCWELPAESMRDEALRRKRINAGRFQYLFQPRLWPWNQPFALLQFVAHKLLRVLLAFFMVGALLGNFLAVVMPGTPEPMIWLFVAQCIFYGLAAVGWAAEAAGRQWRLPAVAYYITYSSLTAIQGLTGYLTGRQTVLWDKARGSKLAAQKN